MPSPRDPNHLTPFRLAMLEACIASGDAGARADGAHNRTSIRWLHDRGFVRLTMEGRFLATPLGLSIHAAHTSRNRHRPRRVRT